MQLVYVGRLFKWKNPINIVKAILKTNDINLVCIGNGPLEQDIKDCVKNNNDHQVIFYNSLENKKVLQIINKSNGVVLNTYYHEISKVMIEAMLLKKIIIVNKNSIKSVPEFRNKKMFIFCKDSLEGYRSAFAKLQDKTFVNTRVLNAFYFAQKYTNPFLCEKRHYMIYKTLVRSKKI